MIPLLKTFVNDDDYDTHSTNKRRHSENIPEGTLYVMKDNTKTIMITMNACEVQEDARCDETINYKNAQHLKTLEL